MTKGKVALPGRAVAGLKHSQERTAGPQISPLHFAPVEMTKGRVTLPGRAVAELKHSQERTAGPQMTKGRVARPGRAVAGLKHPKREGNYFPRTISTKN
jgi:hypothetical protein